MGWQEGFFTFYQNMVAPAFELELAISQLLFQANHYQDQQALIKQAASKRFQLWQICMSNLAKNVGLQQMRTQWLKVQDQVPDPQGILQGFDFHPRKGLMKSSPYINEAEDGVLARLVLKIAIALKLNRAQLWQHLGAPAMALELSNNAPLSKLSVLVSDDKEQGF